jgi:hypothetical protein
MKTEKNKRSFSKTICSILLIIFISILLAGCYHGFGRELFYRFDYYKIKVADIDGNPVKNAKIEFSYQNNFDISGKHTHYHHEKIYTNEQGNVSRIGWVRHEPELRWISADGYYSRSCYNEVKDRETMITLYPEKNPVPLLGARLNFRLKGKYQGKLYFRFSDLELSIPHQQGSRIAYRRDEPQKKEKWELRNDPDFQPDLILDFDQNRFVSIEFASANIPKIPRYHSVFNGLYEAPVDGYKGINWPLNENNRFFKQPIAFTFPYQNKICYGAITFLDSDEYGEIEIHFQLNLTGSRNLERGYGTAKTKPEDTLIYQQYKLWNKNGTRVFTPNTIIKDSEKISKH